MGGLGETYQGLLLDAMLGDGRTADFPATVYITLSDADPDFDGSGLNEPDTADGFGRIAVVNNSTNWPDASSYGGRMAKVLATEQTFPTPTADWGGQGYFAIMDSPTVGAGDVIAFGRWGGQTRNIETDDTVKIPSNTLFIYYREDI